MYDVVIVGGGPAGLTAALYAARARLSTLLIENQNYGGQIATTEEVANYPGAEEGASGPSLSLRMKEQAASFGAEFKTATVTELVLDGAVKQIRCGEETIEAKTVILATGAKPRLAGIPGEEEFTGRGISYCATCDGAFFSGYEVFVIGGGDTAVEEAIFLTRFAKKVTIVHRRDELRAAKSIQEKAFANDKIAFLWDTVVEEIRGEGLIGSVDFRNVKTGEITTFTPDPEDGAFGIFMLIGFTPQTALVDGLLELENGYISTDNDMRTSIPGVFAAGDVRTKSLRQVVTAVADGAIAAVQAEKYVDEWTDSPS